MNNYVIIIFGITILIMILRYKSSPRIRVNGKRLDLSWLDGLYRKPEPGGMLTQRDIDYRYKKAYENYRDRSSYATYRESVVGQVNFEYEFLSDKDLNKLIKKSPEIQCYLSNRC